MRKLILALVIVVMGVGVTGCSTKSSLEGLNPEIKIAQTAKFECGQVTDKSGFSPSGEDVQPASAMETALKAVLNKEGLKGKDFRIDTTILAYSPGNAFARWILPGAGATKLQTESRIYDQSGSLVATLPVTRTIAAGGGYTMGAWREVFQEVAEEIVNVLKEKMLGIKK